jgi:cytochrome c551
MKGKLFAMLMGALLILSACGGSDETSSAETETVAAGDAEKIYAQSCASCHGGDLRGGSSFPDLSSIGATLSAEDIERVIAEGQGIMPPRLIEGDKATVVAEWLAAKK